MTIITNPADMCPYIVASPLSLQQPWQGPIAVNATAPKEASSPITAAVREIPKPR